jgi:N-acetylglucosaminyl-diphospho-decaprenol L-rhamnosyltransferase
MDLSICILTHDQPDLLPRCVASCLAEIQREEIASEIIIIDNASTDGSPQKSASLSPLVRVIRNEENLGFSKANNIGIRAGSGKYVLILNDDTEFRAGALGLLIATLDANPRLGGVGPKFLNADGSFQRGNAPKRFPRLRGVVSELLNLDVIFEKFSMTRDLLTNRRDENRGGEAEQIDCACLLARREALQAVGLFDEGFYFLFEDTDLCYRLKKAGWKLWYVPDAQITHYGGASFKKVMRSERAGMYFEGLIRFFRKQSSPSRFLLFRLTLAGTLCLRMPLAVLFSLSPLGKVRRRWKGTVPIYSKILRSLLFT